MTDSENPYATPEADVTPEEDLANPVVIRNMYINHETSVKSIGTLYIFGSIFILLFGLAVFASSMSYQIQIKPLRYSITVIGLGLAQFYVGLHVRRLASWSRIGIGIFSVLGLLFFPIGTLLCPYFLWLTFSSKGSMVFSAQYKLVRQATPDIYYRPPFFNMATGYLLLALIIGGVLYSILAMR